MDIKKKLENLEKIEYKARKTLADAEGVSLLVFKNKQKLQYCKVVDGKRVYLSKKKDRDTICKLAQEKYARSILAVVEKLKDVLRKFESEYNPDLLNDVYDQMPDELKTYVVSLTPGYEEYGEQWARREYRKKTPPDDKSLKTGNGEYVRSKSELIIANKLKDLGLKYRYENAKVLKGYGTIYPDFTILDPNTNEEVLLEHFGMMDSPEYLEKSFMGKIRLYAENGIVPGKGLICTYETSDKPLDTDYLELLLESYFKKIK